MTLLPPEVSPALAAGLAAVGFGTSGLAAAFGLGGGAILLGVLASVLPPAALIPVHGVVQLASNLGRAALLAREIRPAPLAGFALGAVLGAGAGGLLVTALPGATVRIAVGAFLVWSALAPPPAGFGRTSALAGAASSLLTMFVGATGPFVAAWVKGLGLPRTGFVATHAAMMTVQHGLKTLAFGLLGFAFGPWLGLIALMAGAGVLGTLAGRRALLRIDERLFGRVLSAVLALLGLNLVRLGVQGLL